MLDEFILQKIFFLVYYVHTFYILHVRVDFTVYLRLHLSVVYGNIEDVKLKNVIAVRLNLLK